MLWPHHPVWATLLSVVLGGFSLWTIVTGQGDSEADCPSCKKRFTLRAFESKYRRCPWCFSYSAQDDVNKQMTEVPENFLSETPVFLVPLPKSRKLPTICIVCGSPATGTRQIVANYSIRAELLPATNQITYSLDAPLCESHSSSEKLVDVTLDVRTKKPDGASPYQVPGLKVPSYRFYRTYLEMNAIKDEYDPIMKV